MTVPAILFLSCAMFCASVSFAQEQQDQSVAEAARQERARKQEQQKKAGHVYTDEDLKRAQILTPEDQAMVEAKKNECAQKNNCSPAPSQNPASSLDANSQTPGTSLGEVARRYRKEKELQALKPKQSEPFHLSIGTPALAAPVLPERPAIRSLAQPAVRPLARPSLHPKKSSNVFRRDPFSAVPVRPRVPLGGALEVRPVTHPASRLAPPAMPRISSHPTPSPKLFVEPTEPVAIPETPKPGKAALRIQPVHPFAPRKTHAAISPLPPADVFRSRKPFAPKNLFPSPKPVAPAETFRPDQPSLSLSPDAVARQNLIVVHSGDSLWSLAQQHLGHGNRWPELLAANRWINNPNEIRAGARISLPAATASVVSARESGRFSGGANTSTIEVRKGDTLWGLAKSHLSHSADWPCLAEANPSLRDPNRIFEGQSLVLPPACGSAYRTRPPARARSYGFRQ